MTKTNRIEEYLKVFFEENITDFNLFVTTTERDRKMGIYSLRNGSAILQYLININQQIETNLKSDNGKLVPNKSVTPKDLLSDLLSFKKSIEDNRSLLTVEINKDSDIIIASVSFIDRIIKAIDYCFEIYDLEDENILLYQKLRFHLINEDHKSFIKDLKSILASVAYPIKQQTEGFHHANVYLILKLLGFEIDAEVNTNIGRIDAVIHFSKIIYILEFKFSKNKDDSSAALKQITFKDYPARFKLEKKKIIGLGISFNEDSKTKNIIKYKHKELFTH
jgi:hypothetical protein